jgi:hypothetical protein
MSRLTVAVLLFGALLLGGIVLDGAGVVSPSWARPAARSTDDVSSAEAFANRPVNLVRPGPGQGDCRFDIAHPDHLSLTTGYKAGVKDATDLVDMFVPCLSLQSAYAGGAAWLPEWVAYEVNREGLDAEQWAAPAATIAKLCQDARTGHPAPIAQDFVAMVEKGHAALERAVPVVYFGVVGEDPGVCYLASLRAEESPRGERHRFLTVTAFMLASQQWVYQSVRRTSLQGQAHDGVYELARTTARAFLMQNSRD